jgi:tetratricopeptide (TPR) repeat protein
MLALYRSGRQADALESYRDGRRRLIDELGLEPNEKLQELEHAILTSDPVLALPERLAAATPVRSEPEPADTVPVPVPAVPAAPEYLVLPGPRLLPTDIADFTGRLEQIDAIDQQFALAIDDPSRFAVPVVVMAGKPGIGKTTLAVHVSHRLAERYPDGQLFADLHGRYSDQVAPTQVLERFLRALGVPGGSVPEGIEERAELYRALLSERRMLVVLDNAGGESQVRPLLPGTPQSAVLVTSRARLGGLPGAVHVDLDLFDPGHSVELLARIAGAERIDAEPEATAALAELCGHLPLALRIAGARLAARPHWSIDDLVERLENEARRLDELKHSGLGIRASISLTYDHLEPGARRLFRLLAVLSFPHFSSWVAAALLDEPFPDAQDLLDDLADAQLIETTGTGRGVQTHYRFHDLIRVFARERLMADEPVAEREAALRRVLGALRYLADQGSKQDGNGYAPARMADEIYPLPARQVRQLVESPMAWFERERTTIVAAVHQAAQAGLSVHCWTLALNSVTLFESRFYLSDWRETTQAALLAAEQAGDRLGQAAMLYSSGNLCVLEHRHDEAKRRLFRALEIFEELGDEGGVAMVNQHLGIVERWDGDYAAATARFEEALRTYRRNGDLLNIAYALQNLAKNRLEQGDTEGALSMLPEALDCARRAGQRRIEAQVLHRMGESYRRGDDPERAIEVLRQALEVVRELNDPVGEAYALHGLGMSLLRTGRLAEAEEALHDAVHLAGETGERLVEARVSIGLGKLAMALGNPSQAVVHLHRALGLFRALRTAGYEARALALLNEAYVAIQGGYPAMPDLCAISDGSAG